MIQIMSFRGIVLLGNLIRVIKKIVLVQVPKFVPKFLVLRYWQILSTIQGKLTGHHYICDISKYQSTLSNEMYLLRMTDGTLLVQNRSRISRFIRGKNYALNRLVNQYLFKIDITNLKNLVDNVALFDIGANIGEFCIGVALSTSKTIIFAFEPDPIAFECLKYNILNSDCQDKIKPYSIALSNETKLQTFYLSTNDADSSLFQPKEFDSKIDIQCVRGEDFMNEARINSIDLLKMDAEGYEPEVLEGFGKRIQDINFFAIDVGPERDGLDTEELVTQILLNKGAKVSHFTKEGKRKFLNANW